MFEGLLLEVMCKEELKRTITYDFMHISVVLVFFGPPCSNAAHESRFGGNKLAKKLVLPKTNVTWSHVASTSTAPGQAASIKNIPTSKLW